jgi:2-polyprenyl-6-methoxyphenol hydroxylase-like FAD-dependent oxidoreductase
LLSKIDGQSIHTGKKAIHFDQKEDSISIKFKDGSMHKADFLIVADGIHSVFRKKLLPDSEPRYAGYTCWRAVIENPGINLQGSSETWGDKGRFGIVPLAGDKIYWFACVNAKQNDPGYQKFKVSDLLKHFRNFHEPIPSILKNTSDNSLIWNDIIDLKPIEKFTFDNILLIGDAAHATTPNMGQGACQAIEDAVVLALELSQSIDVKQAFRNFEKRRMKRTHFITKASWRLGKVAQLENQLLIIIRNAIFRKMPSSFNEKQLKKLYRVDF